MPPTPPHPQPWRGEQLSSPHLPTMIHCFIRLTPHIPLVLLFKITDSIFYCLKENSGGKKIIYTCSFLYWVHCSKQYIFWSFIIKPRMCYTIKIKTHNCQESTDLKSVSVCSKAFSPHIFQLLFSASSTRWRHTSPHGKSVWGAARQGPCCKDLHTDALQNCLEGLTAKQRPGRDGERKLTDTADWSKK